MNNKQNPNNLISNVNWTTFVAGGNNAYNKPKLKLNLIQKFK